MLFSKQFRGAMIDHGLDLAANEDLLMSDFCKMYCCM